MKNLVKLPRIIPNRMAIEIYKNSWRVPHIFRTIQKKGNIKDKEIYRTLNMGIGMVLVLSKGDIDRTKGIFARFGVKSHVIGSVIKGKREVIIRA